MARRPSSRGWNWERMAGSRPSPVLYPSYSSLRNDSMTWSVATPTWVAPSSRRVTMLRSTPRVAPTSSPAWLTCDGRAKNWRNSS